MSVDLISFSPLPPVIGFSRACFCLRNDALYAGSETEDIIVRIAL